VRQPKRGMTSVLTSALMGKAETTIAESAPSHLPRTAGGTNSVIVEKPATISAPRPKQNQNVHGGREGGSDGSETKDREIRLVGEAAAVAVTEEAGQERAEHHSQKSHGDELGVLSQSGEAGLQRGAEHGGGDVHVEAIEKHSDAN
jgi:hypothetical protein